MYTSSMLFVISMIINVAKYRYIRWGYCLPYHLKLCSYLLNHPEFNDVMLVNFDNTPVVSALRGG